jgi:phosphoribosylanthranilate isomerase
MSPDPIVKICGMTRLDDARHAVGAGASAIGFVFWKGSPRYIEPERAGEIAAALPSSVTTVGVFVDEPVDSVCRIARTAGLRMVQLHGDEPASYVDRLEQPVMRAVTLDNVIDIEQTWPKGTTLLMDSTDPSRSGSGRAVVDWTRASAAARGRLVVLAGGLTPDNVGDAIAIVRPIGVDVSSGVESAPGVKDLDKVSRFLANARAAFARMETR